MTSRDWPFYCAAYYADDVKRPKRPGELAIETKHRNEASLIAEVQAARSRKDIGRVDFGGPLSDVGHRLLSGD